MFAEVPDSPASNKAVVVLAISLAAALLVIAFLLGRESAQWAPPSTEDEAVAAAPAIAEPPLVEPEFEVVIEASRAMQRPADALAADQATYELESFGARIEKRPDGTLLLSNRQPAGSATAADPSSPPAQPQRASTPIADVPTYFAKMDAIRSERGEGDPNAFAMNLIKATMKGSTSGFDELIEDSERMEAEIRAIAPPASCAGYHEATLDAVAESRELLEDLKTGIQQGNMQTLMGIAQRASALQATARSLDAMRKQIVEESRR